MREGRFIKDNKDRWESYTEPSEDPDEIAKRFTYLVDDLSYAKTFYPNSATSRYINSLAAKIYLSIYENKKEKSHRFITFWTTEVPLVVYKHRRVLLFSLLYFLVFVLIGFFSSMKDQEFVRAILGDGYVDMTELNIKKGDPFGVYKEEAPLPMFLYIVFNNLKVDFISFASGMLTPFFTLYILFQNGIMVGAFEYLFQRNGLGTEFFLVVFIHGTLELMAMVVAGATGLIVGNSILFPKTYSRLASLKMGTKDALKILISLIPVTITAALFESFVTRYTNMPVWLSLFILAISATYMLGYYGWYPHIVNRNRVSDAS